MHNSEFFFLFCPHFKGASDQTVAYLTCLKEQIRYYTQIQSAVYEGGTTAHAHLHYTYTETKHVHLRIPASTVVTDGGRKRRNTPFFLKKQHRSNRCEVSFRSSVNHQTFLYCEQTRFCRVSIRQFAISNPNVYGMYQNTWDKLALKAFFRKLNVD